MRRGRPSLGGWRNENPMHFRPRGVGTPHYRPSRNYGMLDGPRFPPPGPRLNRPPYYTSRSNHGERSTLDRNERNLFRPNHQNDPHGLHNRDRYRDKSTPRLTYPYTQQMRHKENETLHQSSTNFYEQLSNVQPCLVNSTVNIDHRHPANKQYYPKQNLNPTWTGSPIENKKHYYEDQSPNKLHRYHESTEPSKIPLLDYPGHRPPSSDYYGGNPSPVTNNNTSFSRSVDDTVDIVRKRLLNRNESQTLSEDPGDPAYSIHASNPNNNYQKGQNEPPAKKKIQRQKQTVKSNCDQIKNKIVHQLFKMDKDKIHKLMDNPNSSSKFEYAISSLITESQMSLNRHLRSVAEKSLCTSSTDFIQNDNNTIYEDTFMKQMQCILDPQDTVLLEDIKPLVMAELSKFLQIEDYDQTYDVAIPEDHGNYKPKEEYDEIYNFDEYSQKTYNEDQTAELLYDSIENYANDDFDTTFQYKNLFKEDAKPLYERRSSKKSSDYSEEKRQSSESRRKSLDNRPPAEPYKTGPESLPLFNPGAEHLIEEDPFAELDKQYHVPVDHNFIQTEVYASPQQSTTSSTKSNNFQIDTSSATSSTVQTLGNHTININNNFESQKQNIAMSPLYLPIDSGNEANKDAAKKIGNELGQYQSDENSLKKTIVPLKAEHTEQSIVNNVETKCENAPKTNDIDKKEPDKNEKFNYSMKSCTQSNSRKRSIDQRPSHRKEKRKKSESSPTHIKQELPYQNNDVSQCHSKNPETDNDFKNSFIYSYFSKIVEKRDITKDTKKVETTDKVYSDKYVKRKQPLKKREPESLKKRNSNSLSISLSNRKDHNNANRCSLTPTKLDTKTKLKPIDMFVEQPKKMQLHQSHRNTAIPTSTFNKSASNKFRETSSNIKFTRKPIKRLLSRETQTINRKSNISKFSQTEKKKFAVKAVQTEPECFERFKSNSTNTLDRMKEIDLEIQVLLQEKFKLYSSLENKDSCQNSMQTLGMTVVNVTPLEETRQDEEDDNVTDFSADTIVDDFTNIPVEELEQIALESVQEDRSILHEKRTRRLTQKMLDHENSSSNPVIRRCSKKAKPPNISLLEQIITDERPLEEIIVLGELENSPIKKKSQLPKKKVSKKSKVSKQEIDVKSFNLKDCSVVLDRINIEKYVIESYDGYGEKELVLCNVEIIDTPLCDVVMQQPSEEVIEILPETTGLIEEDNNIQFDMLDVSEDIIIGDNCEVKSQDKDMNERIDVPITEEIILDNSQSSYDDTVAPDTSQGENECKMYDYSTDENLRRDSITVTGNADAVLAIECVENNFIAACLDGNVYHFNCDGQLINTLRGSNLAVTCLTIVKEKFGTTVYTGSLDSRIRYYDLETGIEKGPECNVLSPIQTMDRAWDTVFVGTRTGFVLQFECKNNMLIPVSTVKFSEQSILALRAMKEGPRKVLLVAARSENVTIKDAQTGLLLRTLVGPKMTVYTLLFEDGKVYCGTSSHQIHVFDYSTGSLVGSHEGGKGAVCLRATGGLVFAGCYDGCVYVYREGETRPLAQLRGPSLMLLSLAVVGSKIIAGYKDRSLYIWKIPLSILQEMIL